MAVFKVIDNPLDREELVYNACNYIIKGAKNNDMRNCAGRGVSINNAYEDMIEMLNLYGKNRGRRAYHFTVSFTKDTPICESDYMHIGMDISDIFFPEHQVLFAYHHLKDKMPHLHFLVNTASLSGNPKLHLGYTEQYNLNQYINELEYEYSYC